MKNYHLSTPEQHARHARNIDAFCANLDVLLGLAANHAEKRVRQAAIRAINSFALLKADPAGAHALCGPRVKQAIESAVLLIGASAPSALQ